MKICERDCSMRFPGLYLPQTLINEKTQTRTWRKIMLTLLDMQLCGFHNLTTTCDSFYHCALFNIIYHANSKKYCCLIM